MKKITILFVMSMVWSLNILAASGQATFAPFENYYFNGDNFKRTWINVSNVTDKPVTVNFTLYDTAGNLVTDGDNSASSGSLRAQYGFTSYSDNHSDKSAQFVLEPHASARLQVHGYSSGKMMYGTIEWEQDSKASVALISNIMVDRFYRESSRQSSHTQNILVNGGEAF